MILVNFRKELLPFITEEEDQHHHREDEATAVAADADDDCSDVLIVGEPAAIAAHNEDANVALLGHTYALPPPPPHIPLPDGIQPAESLWFFQLRGDGHLAGRLVVVHRLHLRRRAPHLRLRLQQQRSGT